MLKLGLTVLLDGTEVSVGCEPEWVKVANGGERARETKAKLALLHSTMILSTFDMTNAREYILKSPNKMAIDINYIPKNREPENNEDPSDTKVISLHVLYLTSSAIQPLRLREVEVRPADWAGAKAATEVARRAAMASLYMIDELIDGFDEIDYEREVKSSDGIGYRVMRTRAEKLLSDTLFLGRCVLLGDVVRKRTCSENVPNC